MTDPDPLAALLAALAANARDWRARGRDCCAQEAEQMHARLTEAIQASK